MSYVISYDFGTGGVKACLFDSKAKLISFSFESYETRYPAANYREQSPAHWWQAFVKSTRNLLSGSNVNREEIISLGVSGHSLGLIPLSEGGRLLMEWTPIWSDSRADKEADAFFEGYSQLEWYLTSGNGFPPAHYPLFKLMWLRENEPEVFEKMAIFLGTKDYLNYLLTGKLATDYSYASGSGAYDLNGWCYSLSILDAANIPKRLFPEIYPSDHVLGTLLPEVADQLGLPNTVKVVVGGVDNSCMALGAGNTADGKAYNSLGSSSWIAVSSKEPILDVNTKPFVFAHVLPELFTSAAAIFSAGTSLNWYKQQVVDRFVHQVDFDALTEEAKLSPPGANGVVFIPHLAGGSSLDLTPKVKGGFFGLELKHTKSDMTRAVFEGITFGLRVALDALADVQKFEDRIRIVGGGGKNEFWMQLFANVFNLKVQTTSVNQQCAALGAAALAAVGGKVWDDYSMIESAHCDEKNFYPEVDLVAFYQARYDLFKSVGLRMAPIYRDLF
ncbi:xylulokinase [Roseateles sp.]|uniref:xylulokinase n=1 Tax=Roseateles sp. TaxID=1971397 RepID=UPI003D0E1DED